MEVLVIVAPRIEEGFSHLDPTKVTNELDDGEDGEVYDWGVVGERSGQAQLDPEVVEGGHVKVGSVKSWLQELVPEQIGKEVGVDGYSDHLSVG